MSTSRGKRVVSGVQPSGYVHLGNYYGAISQHIALQDRAECYYFIADYHALTTIQDKKRLVEFTQDVASYYLALGLDPKKATLYRQSDVPEVTELAWILATVTGMGLLERAHSYKDKVAKGIKPSMGLFTYPILMAADILIVGAERVPVGEDQVQHVEMTQDMAERFNHTYQTQVLKRPEAELSQNPKVTGTDGQKMSKSYGNSIELFIPLEKTKKIIMSIKTDSKGISEAKDPKSCNVFSLLKLIALPQEVEQWEVRYRQGGVGYGEVKLRLYEVFEETFGKARLRYEELRSHPDQVESVLREGASRVHSIVGPLMDSVRKACGLGRSV